MAISPKLIDDTPDYYDLPQNVNNKGILYEAFLFEKLKGERLTPRGFTPAASDSNAPDIKFMWKGNPYNMEVKLNKGADFGQSGLKYKNNKWELVDRKDTINDLIDQKHSMLNTVDIKNSFEANIVNRIENFNYKYLNDDKDLINKLYKDSELVILNNSY